MTYRVIRTVREVSAWNLGADDWTAPNARTRVRRKGGRALYDAVWTDGNHRGSPGMLDGVRLSAIRPTATNTEPHALMRWIPGTETLEIVEVEEVSR